MSDYEPWPPGWEDEPGRTKSATTASQNTTAEATPFSRTLMRRSELKALPPVEPLIEGIISLRSAVLLVGSTGAGKTFVSIAWACAIGTGTPWLGRDVTRARVLYTVGEGASGLDVRVAAWEKAWGVQVSDDDVIFSIRPASLAAIGTWIEMRRAAEELGCRVIILDTFSSLAPDADETKDAATITRRMADLATAIDGTVILVHHPGWGDATRARGGSQLESNADEVLILHGNNLDSNISLERKKVKEGVAGGRTWLRRKATHGSCIIEGVAPKELAKSVAGNAEQIVRAVFSQPFTRAQLRDALIERMGVSSTTAYEYIGAMDKENLLEHASGKAGTRTELFRIKAAS